MSLQVWLPLNGDLTNQGLSNATITAFTTPTYINNGKIGKALSGGRIKIDSTTIGAIFNNKACSMAFWYNNSGSTGSNHAICGTQGNSEGTNGTGPRQWDFFNYPTKNDFHWSMGSIGVGVLSGIIPDDTWIHFAFVLGDGKFTIYKNGNIIWQGSSNPTFTTYAYDYYINFGYTHYMNDFRIYDHALSPKEVKELAKGLVLHYRLAGPGQENLAKNSSKYTVSNKFTMTTASTDGIMCPGIYYNNFNTTKQYTLTVECDGTLNTGHGALRTPADRYWTIWIYYHDTPFTDTDYDRYQTPICYNSSSAGFKKISDNKYSWTFIPSKANGSIRLNTYSDGKSAITVKFWNIKIEEGSISTPWCPNPADALYNTMGYNNNIEYDCSGYCRNGTKSGTITWDIDSPRYTTSYNFSKSGHIYNNSFGVTTKEYTISLWVKLKPATSQHFLFGTFDSWTGNGIGFYRDANQLGLNCVFKSNGESSWGSLGTGGLSANTWYMVTYTSDGTIIKRYLNGIYKDSLTYGKGGNTLNPVFYIANSKFNGTPASENEEAFISDVRFYATALSAEDIAELYHSAVIVDNTGKNYAYEYFEA